MAVSPRGSPSVPFGSPEGLDSKANIEHGRTGADRKVHTGASKQQEVSCVCVCVCVRGVCVCVGITHLREVK